jgi:hypothetical protein
MAYKNMVNMPEPKIQVVIDKAYKDAVYDFYKTMFKRQMVIDYMKDGTLPEETKDPKQQRLLTELFANTQQKPPYVLITVNPRPGVEFKEFEKVINKVIKKKAIKMYMYVYEVRDENKGLHCHIIAYYDCRPFDLKKGLQNTCKSICDISNPSILNLKYLQPDIVPAKVQYLLGEKADRKQSGVKHTIEYRKQHNINPVYESDPPLPCRDTKQITDLTPPNLGESKTVQKD